MTNEAGLEFEHLEQAVPSREDIQAALDKLDDFIQEGCSARPEDKHDALQTIEKIRAVLTQALERAR